MQHTAEQWWTHCRGGGVGYENVQKLKEADENRAVQLLQLGLGVVALRVQPPYSLLLERPHHRILSLHTHTHRSVSNTSSVSLCRMVLELCAHMTHVEGSSKGLVGTPYRSWRLWGQAFLHILVTVVLVEYRRRQREGRYDLFFFSGHGNLWCALIGVCQAF